MILINLLPHRELARKRRRDLFNAMTGLAVLLGVIIAGFVSVWLQTELSVQQGRNQLLKAEIKRFEGQIKDIANLENEIAALRARQQAVEDLQADRNLPVHLLSELVRQLPDGVYVSSLRQDNQTVSLQGSAQSNERVSELLRNLSNNSPWFARPELVEIVAGNVTLAGKEQHRVANFTIRVRLLRSSEAEKLRAAASGASAAPAMASSASVPVRK